MGSTVMTGGGIATGDIHVCAFVKQGANEGEVLEAGAGDKIIGISFEDGRRSDYIDSASPVLHAKSGEPVKYYRIGARCKLAIGVGGCSPGDLLKPSTNGTGIVTTSNLDKVGAEAQQAASANDFAFVEVVKYELSR